MCCDNYSLNHLFTVWHYLVYSVVNLALGIPSVIVGVLMLESTCQHLGITVSVWLLSLGIVSLSSIVIFGVFFICVCCRCRCWCGAMITIVLRYLVWLWKLAWVVFGAVMFWGECMGETSGMLFPMMYVVLIVEPVFVIVDFLVSCYRPDASHYCCCPL